MSQVSEKAATLLKCGHDIVSKICSSIDKLTYV
jgi:hypothetical protein